MDANTGIPRKPRWCDLDCPAARWPEETALDGSGSCRTFIGLECRILDRVVAKNAPCTVPERTFLKKIIALLKA